MIRSGGALTMHRRARNHVPVFHCAVGCKIEFGTNSELATHAVSSPLVEVAVEVEVKVEEQEVELFTNRDSAQ